MIFAIEIDASFAVGQEATFGFLVFVDCVLESWLIKACCLELKKQVGN